MSKIIKTLLYNNFSTLNSYIIINFEELFENNDEFPAKEL